jgi:D-beta-D-heptose 7-phosphate kinase/D-beta-D-heptose 1-phosphate adenosyltransferase
MQKTESNQSKKLVMVSGGFDPLHIGHIRYIQEAKKLGDELIVVLNCDRWLERKKGKKFMSSDDRAEIIRSLKDVDHVYVLESDRVDVCEAIERFKPAIFANGGDRFADNIPEFKVCQELGIEMVFNVGHGGKVRSSSELLEEYFKKNG